MNQDEPGLQLRVRRLLRQMVAQHRHLKPIYQALGHALAQGADEARSAFEGYREAIDAHFSLEDDFFFPALHGLRPERASDLEALVREHRGFLADVGRIGEAVRAGDLERAGKALEAFSAALAAHESREEELVSAFRERGQAP